MTGHTTTAALYRLSASLSALLDIPPSYILSPFLCRFSLAGCVLLMAWCGLCGAYLNLWIAVMLFLLLLVTALFLALDTLLSYIEKRNKLQDIIDVINGYNATHEVQPAPHSKCSWLRSRFYLSDTYPSSPSVSVQRVYRNGKLVMTGQSLLVNGDVIVLSPGEEAPTPCTSVDGCISLLKGDIYTEPSLDGESQGGPHCKIEPSKMPKLFTVNTTEYEDHAASFLRLAKRHSKLALEMRYILRLINLKIIGVILVLSVIIALLQWQLLPTGLEIQSVLTTLLPLLPTTFPLYYSIVYYYGTARVIREYQILTAQSTDDSPTDTQRVGEWWRLVCLTYRIVTGKLYQYLPRNSNIFDTLASVTVLCTVNKEGILSRANPHVEKIMLLEPDIPIPKDVTAFADGVTEDISTPQTPGEPASSEERVRLISTTSDTCTESEIHLRATAGSLPNLHYHPSVLERCGPVRSLHNSMIADSKFSLNSEIRKLEERELQREEEEVEEKESGSMEEQAQTGSSSRDQPEKKISRGLGTNWLPKIKIKSRAAVKDDAADEMIPIPRDRSSRSKHKKKKKPFWQKLKQQTNASKYTPLAGADKSESRATLCTDRSENLRDDFILVVNLSLSKQSPFGLTFNHTNLADLLGCLKPLGLAALLNNMCHGPRTATSSHLHYISVQKYCGLTFKLPLPTDYCYCVIGRELGFTRAVLQQYEKICTITSYVPNTADVLRLTQRNPVDDTTPLTCIISSVLRDKVSGKKHLISYGTAPFLLKSAYHYWNGSEVAPLQPDHYTKLLDLYSQNRLTSFCYAVAYRPLLDHESVPSHDVFLSLPKGYGFLDEPVESALHSCPGESLLKLQCGQTFLGILCSQFQPVHDVVSLIETLDAANIRFVHFSYENELRSRAFGTKLGLETGWNCHISLAEGDFDQFSMDSDISADERKIFHSNSKARLPQGIRSIKPHLETVDNVPLLVPLFTSSTPPAIREMIQIMQDNNELVCCVGSSLQAKNFRVFLQSDSGIGMVPHLPQHCLISGIKDITLPWPSGDYLSPTSDYTSLTCLHLSSLLNSLPCSLVLSRDNLVIEQLIRVARHTYVSLKQSGHLILSMYVALSLYGLLHQALLLPPPLSLPGSLISCLLVVPTLATLPFTLRYEPAVMQLHTGKRGTGITDTGRQYRHFLGRWSTLLLLGPLTSLASLHLTSCSEGGGSCGAVWSRGGGAEGKEERETLVYSVQMWNLGLVTLTQVVNSVVFAHRTKRLEPRYFLNSWTLWSLLLALLPLLLTALSLVLTLPVTGSPVPIPSIIGLVALPTLQLGFSELSKMFDRRTFLRFQRRQKLKFGTKLGMNSPF